jgi:exonuclease V gamma subunit
MWVGFFMNPAKHYYRDVLGVRFEGAARAVLAEAELFELSGLDKYLADQEIVKAAVAGRSELESWHTITSLQQRGLVPLGEYGRQRFRERWLEIRASLEAPLQDAGLPTGLCLARLLSMADETPVRIALSGLSVDGSVRTALVDGQAIYLWHRHSPLKAAGRLRAWLIHLLLSAQQPNVVSVSAGSDRTIVIPRLAPDEAGKVLEAYLKLLRLGHRAPLPFAPATSLNWLEASRVGKDADEAARQMWESDEHSRGDNADPYCLRAFGAEGPMAEAGFGEVAEKIFGPMLDWLDRTAVEAPA